MRRISALALANALALACVRPAGVATPGGRPEATRGLREPVAALDEPTVRGGRLLPQSVQGAPIWGVEPGGGARVVVAGVRVLAGPGPTLQAAADRLPATPSTVVAVPARLGGGFLFPVGAHLWRAASWLGPALPIFTAPWPMADVMVGLDRVYVRSTQGMLVALDPTSGDRLDLGPLPASPRRGRLAALDAWRAVAIADWRGALVTFDAGSSWRPLALPIEPREVVAVGDAFAVGGLDREHRTQWWTVRGDGQAEWQATAPPAPPQVDESGGGPGLRPLVAAIEDGWPLADGTALLARDGALSRVRLSDGALVEAVADAFPMSPARCHPLSLSRQGDPGAFAFVCGEPQGRTAVYRWDAARSRLVEVRRFDEPREVLASGNGALAARGPCAGEDRDGEGQAWCVMAPGAGWSEVWLHGSDARDARIVVLSDGKVALVRPPRDGNLSTSALTLVDGARVAQTPLQIPPLGADSARALAQGTWTDGFEERRPGVLGGWVDAAGSVVGVEIALDGGTRVGEYIRDAGAPVASGRWAFGWTASRRGFESTDGGMSWNKDVDLPDVIAPPGAVRERACGPVGCLAAGWLRVGWGAPPSVPPPEPPPGRVGGGGRALPPLGLECEPLGGRPPEARGQVIGTTSSMVVSFGATPVPPGGATFSRARGGGEPIWGTVTEFPPFGGHAGPTMGPDQVGVSIEASGGLERALRSVPLARVYAWGSSSGDWNPPGRWQVRWQWPWGGWADARASAVSSAPWGTLEAARRGLGVGAGVTVGWTIAPGDDADHALLIGRRPAGTPVADVFMLEPDRAPLPVARGGGEPFADIESATRIEGRWYLATVQAPSETAATVVWAVDAGLARELARVPRAGLEGRTPVRLARRSDGRALGLLAEGQADGDRPAKHWVLAVDLESGAVGDPEPLAAVDLADGPLSFCTGDNAGWEVELPYPGTVSIRTGVAWGSDLLAAMARLRLAPDQACVDRVLGSADSFASIAPGALSTAGRAPAAPGSAARSIVASVLSARVRFPLRCWRR